jgi:hypothetical protein
MQSTNQLSFSAQSDAKFAFLAPLVGTAIKVVAGAVLQKGAEKVAERIFRDRK